MDIEAELPSDFDQLSPEEKVEKLEGIKDNFDQSTDGGMLKKRLVEELIRKYSERSSHQGDQR